MVKKENMRSTLRKAEKAINNDALKKELANDGIELGERKTFSGQEFFDMVEADSDNNDDRTSITIVLYEEDTPIHRRDEIEDALCDLVGVNDFGDWNGGGSGNLGDGAMFDINFLVNDLEKSLTLFKSKLVELGVGLKTEILYG